MQSPTAHCVLPQGGSNNDYIIEGSLNRIKMERYYLYIYIIGVIKELRYLNKINGKRDE